MTHARWRALWRYATLVALGFALIVLALVVAVSKALRG